jgi:hypothetical protein
MLRDANDDVTLQCVVNAMEHLNTHTPTIITLLLDKCFHYWSVNHTVLPNNLMRLLQKAMEDANSRALLASTFFMSCYTALSTTSLHKQCLTFLVRLLDDVKVAWDSPPPAATSIIKFSELMPSLVQHMSIAQPLQLYLLLCVRGIQENDAPTWRAVSKLALSVVRVHEDPNILFDQLFTKMSECISHRQYTSSLWHVLRFAVDAFQISVQPDAAITMLVDCVMDAPPAALQHIVLILSKLCSLHGRPWLAVGDLTTQQREKMESMPSGPAFLAMIDNKVIIVSLT